MSHAGLHYRLAHGHLTRWACLVAGCEARTYEPPKACVLLLVSVVMTLTALLVWLL